MKHQKEIERKPDDSELMKLAQKGDKFALSELIERYENKIYNYVLRFMHNRQDAEDILQETFLNMIKNIKTFNGGSSPATWIYKIATNAALMKIRASKRVFETLDNNTVDISRDYQGANQQLSESPLETLQNKELMGNIIQYLDELPPNHRSVFILRDIEGFSAKEISGILNISIPAVKSNLQRARISLRDKLVDYINYRGKN